MPEKNRGRRKENSQTETGQSPTPKKPTDDLSSLPPEKIMELLYESAYDSQKKVVNLDSVGPDLPPSDLPRH